MNRIVYRNRIGFPPTVCIELLNLCNLKCLCCRSSSSFGEKRCLKFSDLENLLNGLSEYGEWRISITGGEPLLWKELPHLIELLSNLRFPFSLTTNGNCSEKVITRLPSRFWENGVVHVSIDGNKEIHNYLRGDHSFEEALHFIEVINVFVPKVAVNTVLFTNPKIWAKELLGILQGLKIHHWSIISPVKNGRWGIIDKNFRTDLTYEEQCRFIENAIEDSGQPMPMYKWDFAAKDNILSDIVFVGFDGNIRLPGYYQKHEDYPLRPLIRSINIGDENVPIEIVNSVLVYLESERYIL